MLIRDDKIENQAFVLMSGGLDSTTLLAIVCEEYGPEYVHGISFNYGQSHSLELDAARTVGEHFNIASHQEVTLPDVFRGGESTLVDDLPQPEDTYQELIESYGTSPTYVPARNSIFLTMGSAIAYTKGGGWLIVGVHADDGGNFAYDDCTELFVGSIGAAIYLGTGKKVRLQAPFQYITKAGIVSAGQIYNVPWELTRTCYTSEEVACGKCPSCVSRLTAFEKVGVEDPLPYLTDKFYPVEEVST